MIIPAIDLIDGSVVRLYQGDYSKRTDYQEQPIDILHRYADAGSDLLHIVDLTGAKDPSKRQLTLIQRLSSTQRMMIQTGGGIRSKDDVEQLLENGVSRVVVGSVAVKQPETVVDWIREFGADAVVLALDVNIENDIAMVATHGWQQNSGVALTPLLAEFEREGAKHLLCTDISKDGTLNGTNVDLYATLKREFPNIHVQASGGIGALDDIQALKPTKVDSVILGRSLLEGKFTLEEAIECWQSE